MIFWEKRPASHKFDFLKPFKFILVVGPQRSGGTITAAMIANDLDYEYHEESKVWSHLKQQPPEPPSPRDWHSFFETYPNACVIHCPEHTAYCHQYADCENVAVVLVRRPLKEILASQRRIGWGFEIHELRHYHRQMPPIAQAKYHYWNTHQKAILGERAFEIKYHSLKDHPMWLNPKDRKGFAAAQIEKGKPRGDYIQNKALAG